MLLVFGLVVLLLLAVGSVIAVVELTDRGRIATTPDEVLGVGVLIGGVLVAVGAAIVFWAMLVNAQYRAPVLAQALQVVGATITAASAAASVFI